MAAIYQWFVSYEQVFTTTLYPIEVVDSLEISAELTGGFVQDILQDHLDSVQDINDAEMTQILISESVADTMYSLQDIFDAEMQTILLDTSVDDSLDSIQSFSDAEMEAILIRALTPDDELQISCELTGGSLT